MEELKYTYTVEIVDVYKGKEIPEGKKSVAVSVRIQPINRTATRDELKLIHEKIIRSIEAMGGELRK